MHRHLLLLVLIAIHPMALPCLAQGKPNVVIILADDLGWADVSYHAERADTPNIDRLAAEGIELDRFYVAPMCSPTRAGLLTGRYPIRFGLARAVIPPYRDFGLASEERSLPEALAELGYRHRAVFGKWHLGHLRAKWHPLAQGFTHFEGHYNGAIDYFTHKRDGERDWHVNDEPTDKKGYSTDLIAEAAADFIRRYVGDEAPYFCYVPFNAPHSPFQAKEEDLERYGATDGRNRSIELTLRAMIWSLDQGVGRILKAIDESGEAANTQVWFFSDNGGIGRVKENNLPLKGNKLSAFEGGIRVPACVRWPAAWKGGRKLSQTMGYIDVLPTVLTSAGADPAARQPADRPLDGISLHGLFQGNQAGLPQRDWYTYHGQPGPQQEELAITTTAWKLVVQGPDPRRYPLSDNHEVSLYRMPEDLLEKNNVAKQHQEVVQQLGAKLKAFRSLQPQESVPPYRQGRGGFEPPRNWRIPRDDAR